MPSALNLALSVVYEHFGSGVKDVARLMTGREDIDDLSRKHPHMEVMRSAAVLCQHGLLDVHAKVQQERSPQNPITSIRYSFSPKKAISRLAFPMYLSHLQHDLFKNEEDGEAASALSRRLIARGLANEFDLTREVNRSSSIPLSRLEKVLNDLIRLGYFERIEPVVSALVTAIENENGSAIEPDDVGTKDQRKSKRRRRDSDSFPSSVTVDDLNAYLSSSSSPDLAPFRISHRRFDAVFRRTCASAVLSTLIVSDNRVDSTTTTLIREALISLIALDDDDDDGEKNEKSFFTAQEILRHLKRRERDDDDDIVNAVNVSTLKRALENAERILSKDNILVVNHDIHSGVVRYRANTCLLIQRAKDEYIQTTVEEKFGKVELKVFNVLLRHKYLEAKEVSKKSMLDPKLTRTVLYKMFESSFVSLQEIPKKSDYSAMTTLYLWTVRPDRLLRHLTSDLYDTMLKLRSRKMHVLETESDLFDRQGRGLLKENTSDQERYRRFRDQVQALDREVMRLQHARMLLGLFKS